MESVVCLSEAVFSPCFLSIAPVICVGFHDIFR